MKPSSISFDFGNNENGQKITARRHTNYLGKTAWDITRHHGDQRDNEVTITGITDQQMLSFAEAAKSVSNLKA